MKRVLVFALFLILILVPSSTSIMDVPTVAEDVTIVDEYYGNVNSSHPLYWGNYSYFLSSNLSGIFFVQKGGVHNHASFHTVWNEPIYIVKLTNVEFINDRVIAHNNETHVFFSDGSDRWISDHVCPLCNGSMHGYEFSPYSRAIYWQCATCRLILGEIVQ
jgi:hypothetical protein